MILSIMDCSCYLKGSRDEYLGKVNASDVLGPNTIRSLKEPVICRCCMKFDLDKIKGH